MAIRVAGSRLRRQHDDRLGPTPFAQHLLAEPGATDITIAAQHLAPALDHLHMAGVYLLDNLCGGPAFACELVAGEIDKAPVGLKTAPMTVNPLGKHIFGDEGHQRGDPGQVVGQGLCFAFVPEVEGRKLL